jgi:hypothetical protein
MIFESGRKQWGHKGANGVSRVDTVRRRKNLSTEDQIGTPGRRDPIEPTDVDQIASGPSAGFEAALAATMPARLARMV